MDVTPRNRTARDVVTFALGVVVGAAVLWAVQTGRPESPSTGGNAAEHRAGVAGGGSERSADGPQLEPRRQDPARAPAAATTTSAPVRTDPLASPEPLAAAAAAWIEITIEPSAEWPTVHGVAYALPARAGGEDEVERMCHVEASTERAVRLPVPTEGLYDVGFVWDFGWVFAADVRVTAAGGAAVALRPPPAVPVTVRLDGGLPAKDATQSFDAWVHLLASGEGPARKYPGRGERPVVAVHQRLEPAAGDETRTSPLPKGWTFATSTELDEQSEIQMGGMSFTTESHSTTHVLLAEPAVVAAGGAVRLRLKERVPWNLRVRVEPASGPGFLTNLELEWHHAGGSETTWQPLDRDLVSFEALAAEGLTQSLAPGPVSVTWSGEGLLSGSLGPVELAAGAPRVDEIVVRLDPDAATSSEKGIPLDLSALPAEMRPASGLCVYGVESGESLAVMAKSNWNGERHFLGPEWRKATSAIATVEDSWVSPPERPALSGEWRPAFVRGGWLVVMPEFEMSAKLGALRLRRADGAPFVHSQPAGESSGVVAIDVMVGTLLGPFPPGPVRFTVKMGSHALPDAVAEVRAGGATSLVLRLR